MSSDSWASSAQRSAVDSELMSRTDVRPTPRLRASLATGALLAAGALILSGCSGDSGQVETQAGKPMPDATAAALQAVLDESLNQTKATQILVGVWAPWEGDFVQGITTDGSSLSIDTQFRAAQSSQAVICAALLTAVEDGELSLDRKVSKDLPRQVGIEGITYGQLCEGTSGLADFKQGLEDTFANNPTRIWPDRELLAAGIVRSPLSKPGAEFHLSDTNTLLLGRALTLTLEEPLPNILRTRVFEPGGLSRTVYPQPTTLSFGDGAFAGKNFALDRGELQCDTPQDITEVSNSMLGGAGGTVSTITNLRDFYADYLTGVFGGGDAERRIKSLKPFTAATEEVPASLESWGFGLMNIGPLWGNAGEITGTISAAFHDPISGYSVVIALNNSSAGADYARDLALKLTSVIANEAPGGLADLPWDEDAVTERLAAAAVCQPTREPTEEPVQE